MIENDFGTKNTTSKLDSSIENGYFEGRVQRRSAVLLIILRIKGDFSSNLELVDSFYDEDTSLSGVVFKERIQVE